VTDQTVLVAIDIGTTKVCVLIGEVGGRSGGVDVIGIGQAPSDGLRKGVVIDIDRTVQSVAAAVDAAERLSGLKVRSAFVGISGHACRFPELARHDRRVRPPARRDRARTRCGRSRRRGPCRSRTRARSST
jgi:cell division ATPase FtsA